MRISCSFWYIVVSLLVLLASCDDSKKVDRLIEKEKQEARQREEERKKREEEEKRQEEERKKKEEEERKKREEEEQKKKEEEKRKKKEEEEQKKKKEEEAKFKVLEGVYSGKRTSGKNGQSQIDEVFNVTIGYPEGDKKWNVAFSSVQIKKTADLITQEEDKLIFHVEWRDSYNYRNYSATLLFTPSLKKLKITTTCGNSDYNWTYEGTKQ